MHLYCTMFADPCQLDRLTKGPEKGLKKGFRRASSFLRSSLRHKSKVIYGDVYRVMKGYVNGQCVNFIKIWYVTVK